MCESRKLRKDQKTAAPHGNAHPANRQLKRAHHVAPPFAQSTVENSQLKERNSDPHETLGRTFVMKMEEARARGDTLNGTTTRTERKGGVHCSPGAQAGSKSARRSGRGPHAPIIRNSNMPATRVDNYQIEGSPCLEMGTTMLSIHSDGTVAHCKTRLHNRTRAACHQENGHLEEGIRDAVRTDSGLCALRECLAEFRETEWRVKCACCTWGLQQIGEPGHH